MAAPIYIPTNSVVGGGPFLSITRAVVLITLQSYGTPNHSKKQNKTKLIFIKYRFCFDHKYLHK